MHFGLVSLQTSSCKKNIYYKHQKVWCFVGKEFLPEDEFQNGSGKKLTSELHQRLKQLECVHFHSLSGTIMPKHCQQESRRKLTALFHKWVKTMEGRGKGPKKLVELI